MKIIPNQPVKFYDIEESIDECTEDFEIPQLVDVTDTTQFQLGLEVCPATPNEIENNQFSDGTQWYLTSNWSISNYLLCHTAGATTIAGANISLDVSKYYQIIITVASISFGSSFNVRFGYTIVGTITSIGVFTFYGFPVALLGVTAPFIEPVSDGDICISETDIYEVKINEIIAIKDLEGNQISVISYKGNPELITIVDDTMTININWADLGIKSGCYRLCLADACENTNGQNYPAIILNGDFTTPGGADWVADGDVDFDTTGRVILGANGQEFTLEQDIFSSFLNSYCIQLDVLFFDGDECNVYFGTNLVRVLTVADVNTTVTINGICADDLTLRFVNSGNVNIEITNIVPCENDVVCDYISNTFKLGDYSGACTMLINACNNEDGLGFNFNGSGFTPRLRLTAKLRQGKYPNEKNIYEDSKGTKGNYYFSGRKQKYLCVDLQPEYVLDFLALLLGFDNVYLDGELHVVDDDEFNVQWSETNDNIGSVKLLVSKKTQNVKNANCSDDVNICTLPPNYLIQEDGGGYILQTDGFKILING